MKLNNLINVRFPAELICKGLVRDHNLPVNVQSKRINMKTKNLLILLIAVIGFASCSKQEDIMVPGTNGTAERKSSSGNVTGPIGNVPATFTQKAILENFTSSSNRNCADNDLMIRNAMNAYPGRIIPVSFHVNDAMYNSPSHYLISYITGGSMPAIPGVMQNRKTYNGKLINDNQTWNSNLSSTLSGIPCTGLAIHTVVSGNSVRAEVHCGFNSNTTGDFRLMIYVSRNNVTGAGSGYDQANGSNNNPSSPLYNMGDPIANYIHNYVAYNMVTPVAGISIPESCQVPGGRFIRNEIIDYPGGISTGNLFVIAFIVNAADGTVLNAQQVQAGRTQNWD